MSEIETLQIKFYFVLLAENTNEKFYVFSF